MAAPPISPPPVRRWDPSYIPAYLSNGLLGIRAGSIPLVEGVTIVSGLASLHPDEGVQGFARGPYPFAGDITIGGLSLRQAPSEVHFKEQRYDFNCGELTSRFDFKGRGATASVTVVSYCSRSQPTCAVQEVRIQVDGPVELGLTTMLDTEGVAGRELLREQRVPAGGNPVIDGVLHFEPPGGLTTCGAAYHTELEGAEPGAAEKTISDSIVSGALATHYRIQARPGREYALHQLASLISSDFAEDPHREATRLATTAALRGFTTLQAENRRAWGALWRGRPLLIGAGEKWQSAADAAYYYLHASAHSSSLFSTAMFGLAYWPNYHYYRGQVMWDIEAFAHPALVLTQPQTSQALLRFRTRHLDSAALNAALNGYEGLQFPWAASLLEGEEAIRTDAPLVTVEQHVNQAVPRAFARQAEVTGDALYLREAAWPVLAGVARWIESRGEATERGFEIKHTLGPAEMREAPVDNDAYVNLTARRVLLDAAWAAEVMGDAAAAVRWTQLAGRIFVPISEGGAYVLNHDRFTPAERGVAGATPETLAAIFPFGCRLDPLLEERTVRFYLDRVDEYLGFPMLSPLLGVFAARLGERERATHLFEAGYLEYVNEPWNDPNEFSRTRHPDKPVAGPFYANLGAFLTSLLYGLTGLEPNSGPPEQWFPRPPAMPDAWEGVEVERVFVRGAPRRLVARQGDERARFEEV